MDQYIVGKISRYNKTKFIAAAVLCVLLLLASAVCAADPQREFELFDRGYKEYLSYHPDEAAKEFRTFLKEFPRSSARDAVLFWLGKSLEQLKSFEEAKRIFADIKQEYPDSPFLRYADKEIETVTGMSGFAGTVSNTMSESKIAGSVAVKTAKTDDQARIQEKEIQRAAEQKKESKSVPVQKEISKKAEVQIAQVERSKEAGDGDRLKSLSGREEKSANVLSAESGRVRAEGAGSKPVAEKAGKEKPEKNETPAASTAAADRTEKPQFPTLSKKGVVYSIQIGAYTKQKTADRIRTEMEKEGYSVKIMKGISKGSDVFKILVGQFAGKNEAKSVAHAFTKKYGENTIVSMSVARDETPPAQVEFLKAAQDAKKPGSPSTTSEKETVKIAAAETQTASKDLKPEEVRAKTQSQQTSEEMNKHAVASKNEKENVNVTAESSKGEKKQTETGPVEKKKVDLTAMVAQAVNKESQPKEGAPKHPEQAKSNDMAGKNDEGSKTGGKKLSSAPIQPGAAEKPRAVEAVEKLPSAPPPAVKKETRPELVKKEIKSGNMGSGPSAMEVKDLKYTTRDIPAYAAASRSLCDKLKIKEVLWRTGNDNEDFLNEQALYGEAKDLHITTDKNKLTEMIENYQLDDREADYLQRYLAISSVIERKIRDMPEEKVVESIVVRYDESDRYMKIVLGSDLQDLAKKGTPFEEIYRLYPDIVRFSVTGFPELEKRIKEKVQSLQNNEVVVTWSEDGYMMLKPVFKGPVFRPFGDISPGLRDRIRTYVLAWTKGLRENYAAEPVKEKK